MSTISELVARYSKVPGDIKVTNPDWPAGSFFIPYFKVDAFWHGVDDDGIKDNRGSDGDFWELYTEPKAKKKLYQWAHTNKKEKFWDQTTFYAETEYEVITALFPRATPAGLQLIRLDHTMIEVDE